MMIMMILWFGTYHVAFAASETQVIDSERPTRSGAFCRQRNLVQCLYSTVQAALESTQIFLYIYKLISSNECWHLLWQSHTCIYHDSVAYVSSVRRIWQCRNGSSKFQHLSGSGWSPAAKHIVHFEVKNNRFCRINDKLLFIEKRYETERQKYLVLHCGTLLI